MFNRLTFYRYFVNLPVENFNCAKYEKDIDYRIDVLAPHNDGAK